MGLRAHGAHHWGMSWWEGGRGWEILRTAEWAAGRVWLWWPHAGGLAHATAIGQTTAAQAGVLGGAPDRAVCSRGAVIASESGSWLSALWGAEARKSLEEPRQVQEAQERGWLRGRR